MTVTTVPAPQHPPADSRLSHEPPAAIAKRGWRSSVSPSEGVRAAMIVDNGAPNRAHLVPQEQRCPQGMTRILADA